MLTLHPVTWIDSFHKPMGGVLKNGLVLDTETTGITSDCQIIEFCAIPFQYEDDRIVHIDKPITMLEQPVKPITPEISDITGLTNEDLQNKKFDDKVVIELFEKADLVIAHNAGFDRPFIERRFNVPKKVWACTQKDVNWKHISSHSLEFLVFKMCNRYYEGHRAEIDCWALLYLLATKYEKKYVLTHILDKVNKPQYRVKAVNSPISTKEKLKARKYKWDVENKYWYKDIVDLEEEEKWLTQEVYNGFGVPKIDTISLLDRYYE